MKPPSDSEAILVFPSQGEGDCAHCAAPPGSDLCGNATIASSRDAARG